jgi:hypothetical protein
MMHVPIKSNSTMNGAGWWLVTSCLRAGRAAFFYDHRFVVVSSGALLLMNSIVSFLVSDSCRAWRSSKRQHHSSFCNSMMTFNRRSNSISLEEHEWPGKGSIIVHFATSKFYEKRWCEEKQSEMQKWSLLWKMIVAFL